MKSCDPGQECGSDGVPYQTKDDASTLQKHAELVGNPKRHAAAMDHLQKQKESNDKAITMNKNLRGRVKKGLNKAFPKADDNAPTPFEAAEKEG